MQIAEDIGVLFICDGDSDEKFFVLLYYFHNKKCEECPEKRDPKLWFTWDKIKKSCLHFVC